MNLNDLNILDSRSLLRPITATATQTSAGVDLQTYEGVLKVMQHVGVVTGTTPTLDTKIQDSADNTTFADVAGLSFAQVTASNVSAALQVDTRAVRRYIRAVSTIAGTTPSIALAVNLIGMPKRLGTL